MSIFKQQIQISMHAGADAECAHRRHVENDVDLKAVESKNGETAALSE